MREGPAVQTITRMTCLGCKYYAHEYFYETADICKHPGTMHKYIEDDTGTMPEWCPLYRGEGCHEAFVLEGDGGN